LPSLPETVSDFARAKQRSVGNPQRRAESSELENAADRSADVSLYSKSSEALVRVERKYRDLKPARIHDGLEKQDFRFSSCV
jgi:hypothetical protein